MKLFPDTPYSQLIRNLATAEEVYKAANYGALHLEASNLQILEKMGLENIDQVLKKSKYKEAIIALDAISQGQKNVSLTLSESDVVLLRKVMKGKLQMVRNIPALAREQLVITYCILVEGFVNDTIRNFFEKFPQSLKSNKSTLKDYQLIDAIIAGNTLEKLINHRVRELMYDSITGWIDFMNEKGFSIKHNTDLKEMFLIRNVLIHNNKKAGSELIKEVNKKRYILDKKINVSDSDTKRFKKAIDEVCREINSSYHKKIKDSSLAKKSVGESDAG
ncbi:hypothetical protein [Pedobacter miscanthi]|uniref:RiboL-PSP-HEPN domain-containing protein n=1 Tax=Pedobacter miscanthi TaxID=2259170 RepID=A0A366L0P5_9SPHI|nr:hypothetical protein [Pedobacter miscanthi]RBQ06722.1 hypothetical protein DRW42_13135 [Pedobacter miscanthi]